jgi:hypothetical protein
VIRMSIVRSGESLMFFLIANAVIGIMLLVLLLVTLLARHLVLPPRAYFGAAYNMGSVSAIGGNRCPVLARRRNTVETNAVRRKFSRGAGHAISCNVRQAVRALRPIFSQASGCF